MSYSVKMILQSWKKNSTNKHLVLMQVTINSKKKRYSLGSNYACKKSEWDSKYGKYTKAYGDWENANTYLEIKKNKALNFLIDLEREGNQYTVYEFDNKYKNESNGVNVLSFFDDTIKEMKKTSSGNADVYKETRNSIERYLNKKKKGISDFPMTSIDHSFLKAYERYLQEFDTKKKGPRNEDSSIFIRLRTLRSLFNIAIKQKKISHYPFSDYSLAHLHKKKMKKTPTLQQLKTIFHADVEMDSLEYQAIQYFKFMFFTRGMNFRDMAKLKKTEVFTDHIHFGRKKTGIDHVIPLLPATLDIIKYFSKYVIASPYVFPILLPHHEKDDQIKNRAKKVLNVVNKEFRNVAERVGVDFPITSNYMRHTFATELQRNGTGKDTIQVLMFHENMDTTENYLSGLENSVVNEEANKLYKKFDEIELEGSSEDVIDYCI